MFNMLLSVPPCFVFHIFIVLVLLCFQTSCKWGGFRVLCLEMGVGQYVGRVLGAVLGEDRGAVLGMGLCLGEWDYARGVGGYA